MDSIISVNNLTKRFGKNVAVNGASFTVHEGEIFGLLGPNGAGKTTTIHMLLDVIEPDAGEIRMFGKSFRDDRETIMKSLNFSSSYLSLPWNLSLEENLMLFARLFSVAAAKKRVDEVLELFELTSMRTKHTGKLSSGQSSRLLLAKALINSPRILLLDEPTSSMDPDFADRIRTILKDLAVKEKTTIIYTSHNMAEVESMCDRVAFLNKGRILSVETPQQMVARYGKQDLEDVFIHIARTTEGRV